MESLHFGISPSLLDDWSFSKDNYKCKDVNSRKTLAGDDNYNIQQSMIGNSYNWYPSNLREICISNYNHCISGMYNVICNILENYKNIPKFSLLQIKKSSYDEIGQLFYSQRDSMIKSIVENRLNCIILQNISCTDAKIAKQENDDKQARFYKN